MTNILYLRSVFTGEDIYFNRFIERLDTDRFRPIICYLRGPVPKDTELAQKGYEVFGLPYKRQELRYFNPKIIFELKKILAKKNIGIVHAYRHKPTVYAVLAAFTNKDIKIISHVLSTRRSRSISRKLQNLILMQRVDAIIGVSAAVSDDIKKNNYLIDQKKIRTIYTSVDLERFVSLPDQKTARSRLGLPQDGWIWGTIGRLAPVKGHDILLKAFAAGNLGRKGCHLAIAGDGRLRAWLVQEAEKLGIADNVTFLGHIADIPCFLATLDGFVFPSRQEGLGRALIEALAAGLPCVASRIGGIEEILQRLCADGHAFLVPPEDDLALLSAMEDVMNKDQGWRADVASASKDATFLFGIDGFLKQMDAMYSDLVSK
ncbi:MAG: glycosyltransferase [Dissulfurimicrobium sp.]|uniref:glycosyltransferase n=1 Tax=Dissulfurimicrobium TaxID=1769732 RepID=UPI001EDB42E7|nr:glycosyltransferase [Dissulfurimicrobium hydrothermale]UKL13502.1 glycosyltransferase [Dissulfurimicrobium hydrothermale]